MSQLPGRRKPDGGVLSRGRNVTGGTGGPLRRNGAGGRSSGAQVERPTWTPTSAPADATQDVRPATSGVEAHEGALDLGCASARDRLRVTGGATLHGAAWMVHPADGRSAVAALLGFVTVPRPRLLAPADGGIDLAADHHGVGQAADSFAHLATTVRTNGHDAPLVSPRIRSFQARVTGPRMGRPRADPAGPTLRP